MVYRIRQGLSPSYNSVQTSNNRDRYLDNCFLLCINPNDDTDVPEIYRLENNLVQDLYHRNSLKQIKNQQKSKFYIPNQQEQTFENYDDDDNYKDTLISKHHDCSYRQNENPYDKNSQLITNQSKYRRENDYKYDQYSRTIKSNYQNDNNLMQHSDDELSVYEVS